jgi:beta-mannosidase
MSTTRISLDGEWALRWCEPGEGEEGGWAGSGVAGPEAIAARVPGMTHLDLQASGQIQDPLFGENARDLEWMEEKDWWYSASFDLAEEMIGGRVEVVFEGLDCLADIWINGERVGSSRNALVPWRADITAHVRRGDNLVVVRLDTGLRWALQQDLDRYATAGSKTERERARVFLRHSQYSFRWDWAPRLLTCGIWQPVRIEGHEDMALRDVCLRSRLAPGNRAALTALVEVEVFGQSEREVLLGFTFGDESGTELRATLAPGRPQAVVAERAG